MSRAVEHVSLAVKEIELLSGAIKRKLCKLTVKVVLVHTMFQRCAGLMRIKLDSHRGTSRMCNQ